MKKSSVFSFKAPVLMVAFIFSGLLIPVTLWAADAMKTATATPAECTTSQYHGLNKAKAFCAADSYACVSTPYGGCSPKNTPWKSNQCSTQCKVTDNSPWLNPSIPKPSGSNNRTITYNNSCGFDVWAGYTGGAIDGTP